MALPDCFDAQETETLLAGVATLTPAAALL